MTKDFYHQLITQRSWKILQALRKNYDFILIGGWAVWIYTEALKSKDIDLIIDYPALAKFKSDFNLQKNERLKKYEAKIQETEIDIYLPFYSNLGFPIEKIQKQTISRKGFVLPSPEILLILKQVAFSSRQGSIKGEKDKVDIFSLIFSEEFDYNAYQKLIKKEGLDNFKNQLKKLLKTTSAIPQLEITRHQMARLKKKFT